MYEEDRENREDRDQEIERTEIMDDVDEQETQTSSSRSQENRKSGSSQNVNWTTPNRSSERTSSERKTQWQESRQQNNRPEHGYRNEYRETVQAPRKKNSWARKAAGITAAAVLFGTVAGGVMTGVNYVGARLTGLADITATAPAETEGTTTAQVPETSAASNNGSTTAVSTVTDVSSIAEKAMPSLVAINDTMTVEQNNFFGMPQTYQAQSSGSGIIVGQNDTELLIATNNHVVSGATDMKVTFTDSTQVAAAVKGTDSATVLLDVTPLSLGIETLGGVCTKIIDRNTTIPTHKSQVFSTAADNQPSVEVNVLQGEREFARDNKSLGVFHLDGIAPAPRGVPQIEVTFDIDANGIVKVSAKDLGTGKEQNITITASTNMSKEDIDKAVKEAEQFAADDKKKREEVDIRNGADQMVFQTEKMLKENGDKMPADVKSEAEAKLADLKTAVQSGSIDEIKAKQDELSHVFEKMYQAAAAAQQAAGAQPGPDAGANNQQKPNDDGVVDADFKEV